MSVRLNIRWSRDRQDCRVEAISEDASHLKIEAKASADNVLVLEFAIGVDAETGVGKNHLEEAPEKADVRDGVDDTNGGRPIVDQNDRFALGSFSTLGFAQGLSSNLGCIGPAYSQTMRAVGAVAKPSSDEDDSA